MHFDGLYPTPTFSDTGLLLGAATPIVPLKGFGHPVDGERLCGLLSIAFGREPNSRELAAVTSAASHWQDGDRALANLRLVFAGLPRLDAPEDIIRLKAAELLFDAGLRADDLDRSLPSVVFGTDVQKFDPNQPRVQAGTSDGGQWTKNVWGRFSAWLDAQVPIYDQDTGIQVGTQSRARAIATSPLTVAAAGTAALFGGEALLPAAAPAVEVGADLTTPSRIAANAARGAESEARVLREMGLVRNTQSVATAEGRSVPDALTEDFSVEVKDALRVTYTKQVRIQTEAAKAAGRESWLVTGKNTSVSRRAYTAFTRVIEWPRLGP